MQGLFTSLFQYRIFQPCSCLLGCSVEISVIAKLSSSHPCQHCLVFTPCFFFCSDLDIVIHPPEGDPPASWWDEECDKSLLIGVYKYGQCDSHCPHLNPYPITHVQGVHNHCSDNLPKICYVITQRPVGLKEVEYYFQPNS